MRGGKLKHSITIEKTRGTKDDYGQDVQTWVEVCSVRADIRPIGGKERLAAMAYESKITHTVAIRYTSELEPLVNAGAYRILFGDRVLQIIAGRNLDEKNRMIVFDCEEGPADG